MVADGAAVGMAGDGVGTVVGGGVVRRSVQGSGSRLHRPIMDTTMAIRTMVTDTIHTLIRRRIMAVTIAPTTLPVTTRVVTIITADFSRHRSHRSITDGTGYAAASLDAAAAAVSH